ncbi:MAG: PASTA domain-containing protein [Flavobacteriales bacterium]|nr:hypothetical protein [Flavobacteriales bacterium]MCC6576309.1 PASTA domain-containing protein [Flavobacteriales bacterium]NUQ15256.1 PASTA domain-containing protein [Flavobacteriales bacterium]
MRRALPYLLPVLVSALLLLGGWSWVRQYTRHGVVVEVPDLTKLTVAEAAAAVGPLGLHVEVVDSVHTDAAPKGTVVDQDPDAGAGVKPDRKVYLMVNAMRPKLIDMPTLVDLSKRQAISVAEIVGLKVAELRYRPDACVDCVLEQLYQGRTIIPGTGIERGASIVLVLGSGEGGERVPVPDLTGWTYAEVAAILNMASLNLGAVVACEGCNTKADSALAKVFRQSPMPTVGNSIGMGGLVDVWLTTDTAGLGALRNLPDSTPTEPATPDVEP